MPSSETVNWFIHRPLAILIESLFDIIFNCKFGRAYDWNRLGEKSADDDDDVWKWSVASSAEWRIMLHWIDTRRPRWISRERRDNGDKVDDSGHDSKADNEDPRDDHDDNNVDDHGDNHESEPREHVTAFEGGRISGGQRTTDRVNGRIIDRISLLGEPYWMDWERVTWCTSRQYGFEVASPESEDRSFRKWKFQQI